MEVAVISGKGGTGKSAVSAAFATLNERVVLADCDVDAANLYLIFNPLIQEEEVFISGQKAVMDKDICSNCGICMDYCRFDAITEINGEILIDETSCDGCQLCARVCPVEAISMIKEDKSRLYAGDFRNGKMVYGRLSPGEENSGRLVDVVRDKAKEMALPHYMILPQKTMVSLVNFLPQSLQTLKQIRGIGKKKTEKYGEELLDLIVSYCTEKDIQAPDLNLIKKGKEKN